MSELTGRVNAGEEVDGIASKGSELRLVYEVASRLREGGRAGVLGMRRCLSRLKAAW